jgi:hypothetical protein
MQNALAVQIILDDARTDFNLVTVSEGTTIFAVAQRSH